METPLRVVHMIGSPKAGGAEMFALRLLRALHDRDDVDVMAIVRKGSWLEEHLREAHVRVETMAFGGMFDFLTHGRVRRLVRAFNPAVVQSWMNRSSRFVPKGPWKRVGRLGGFYDLKYYRGKVEELVCNTPEICDYCVDNGWPKDHVTYIGNFVPEPLPGWRDCREDVRAELGFAETDCVLMMAGRIHPVKGIDVALQALTRLPEHFCLLLVGEGPSKAVYEQLSRTLNVAERVRWAGWTDDISKYAAAADVWLAPSRHEPLGNTVLDAWAHGLPVIASNTGGLALLVENNDTGLLVTPDDATALADAIGRLWADDALLMHVVEGGRQRFGHEFSAKVIVGEYMRYYRWLSEGADA